MVDCPSEFRRYWLQTKLAESRADISSSTNPCRFVAIEAAPCTPEHLERAYALPAPPERDGLLFLHKEALYEPGASPLFLSWSDASCSTRFYDYGPHA